MTEQIELPEFETDKQLTDGLKERMSAFANSFPVSKTRPGEDKLCFFMVSRPDRKSGEKQRIRRKVGDARRLLKQGYSVIYCINQEMPSVGYCAPGSQKAQIYGARGKPPWEQKIEEIEK